MPVYDFVCKCGEVTEAVRGMGVESIPCSVCGQDAERVAVNLVTSKITDHGVHPSISCPGDIKDRNGRYRVSLWQEAQAEASRPHDEAEKREGRKIERPNPYKEATEKVANANL